MNRLSCSKLIHFATLVVSINVCHCFAQQSQPPRGEDGFQKHSNAKVILGQKLFFDKILSGNKNISCASCHHPLNGTADSLPLGIGTGGQGLGPSRVLEGASRHSFDVKKRIPRNAPALFNLGHEEFVTMFHDGRVQAIASEPSGFKTPAKENTPKGLDSALAAQALFPPTSADEMAGEPGTNKVADAAAAKRFAGPDGVWDLLAARVRAIPEYVSLFNRAYPGKYNAVNKISMVDIANAIAAFESAAWRADKSPYDRFMSGDANCMSKEALEGLTLFMGKGQCVNCHSGTFQTDHRFHSIAMPQIGPGKGHGPNGNHDYGREGITGRETDRYKFRTPSLRNVALTAPYGHAGAYYDLKTTIQHHMNPTRAITNFDGSKVRMPQTASLTNLDVAIMQDRDELRRMAEKSEISNLPLSNAEIDKVVEFLYTLTDPRSYNMLNRIPTSVPSGLSLHD